jgi:transposase InsO family protein
VSASAYYQRAAGERSARAVEDERLVGVIRELHAKNYFAYGSRRMWKAPLRAGAQVGRSRVERLLDEDGIQGAKRGGRPWRTMTADAQAARPDLVRRDLRVQHPDELWFADFTYLRSREDVVFFAFVIDAYGRQVVGWQFAENIALQRPVEPEQYTSIDYTQTLEAHHVLASVGDAYDNALAESLADSFKTELIRYRVSRTTTNSSSRSSNTSPGTTTTDCTSCSATSHPPTLTSATRLRNVVSGGRSLDKQQTQIKTVSKKPLAAQQEHDAA